MVNVICIGSSGFVGNEILCQLIENDNINKITCLSRNVIRIQHPKLNTIIHQDFSEYSDELLKELAQSNEICYWTIGGKSRQFDSFEEFEKVSIDYTITFTNGLCKYLKEFNRKLTMVFCSALGSDIRADKSWIPIEVPTRMVKAKVENKLKEIQIQYNDNLNLLIFRPGGILPINRNYSLWFFKWLFNSFIIGIYELSNVMIEKSLKSINNNNSIDNGTTIYSNSDVYYSFYKDGWFSNNNNNRLKRY